MKQLHNYELSGSTVEAKITEKVRMYLWRSLFFPYLLKLYCIENLFGYQNTLNLLFMLQTERNLSNTNDRQNSSNSTFNSTKKVVNEKGSPTNGPKGGVPARVVDFPLRVLVQSEMVGAIIGRSGQTIKQITQQSRLVLKIMFN